MVFNAAAGQAPEQIHVVTDPATGLDGVIVLHSTALGPALGGCRMLSYPDRNDMIAAACRLSRAMSYTNALADLPFGGGAAVIGKPPGLVNRRAMFEAFGRAVRSLDGSYVTAQNDGTGGDDMSVVAGETRYVAGLPGRGSGGSAADCTARGVFLAMRHAVRRRLERDLSECTVAVQGVGCVGAALAQLLHDAGARLVVADVDAEAAARTAVAVGADVASVASILGCDADVVAPCAVGGVLNQRTIPKLRAKVVCGAASNQLHAVDDGDRLAARGILYAPDFVANAGGIIRGGSAYLNWPDAAVTGRVERIPHRLAEIFDLAERHGVTPEHAAEQLACEVIAAGAHASRRAA